MKKGFIIVLLILMVGILFFQYLSRNKAVSTTVNIVRKTENIQEEGVSLPKDAGNVANIVATTQREIKPRIVEDKKDEPVPEHIAGCTHNSVPSILADYGTIWGDNPKGYVNRRKYVFNPQEVIRIKDLLARYYACRAVVAGTDSGCSELPHQGDTKSTSMSEYCKDYYTYSSFAAYMSGKAKDPFACLNYWDKIKAHVPRELKENVFCKAASNGLPKLCDSMEGQGLDHLRGLCHNVFPKTPEGCVNSPIRNLTSISSADCKKLYSLYNGISHSDSSDCPSEYQEICAALISGNNSVCTRIKDKLVVTYCDIYKKVQASEEEYLSKEMEKSKMAEKNKKGKSKEEEIVE